MSHASPPPVRRSGFPAGSLPGPAAQATPAFGGRAAGLAPVRRSGFALILVLCALMFAGAGMAVIGQSLNAELSRTRRTREEAQLRQNAIAAMLESKAPQKAPQAR